MALPIYNNSSVRRQERLLDEATAETLLREGEYGVLSMVEQRNDETAGYGIPINFVWDSDRSIYFHCAPEGHKLRSTDTYPEVSFTVVGPTHVVSEKFTTAYQSIIVRGRIQRMLPPEQRMNALRLLLAKYSPNDLERGAVYAEKSFHRTEIMQLRIETISGKGKHLVY